MVVAEVVMRPIYTEHARDQMNYRRISASEGEYTLTHPFRREISRTTGNTIYFGRPSGRFITVVVARGSHPLRVVTASD
jgi:hypothetical protein